MAKRFALTRKWIRRVKKLNAIEARRLNDLAMDDFLHYLSRPALRLDRSACPLIITEDLEER